MRVTELLWTSVLRWLIVAAPIIVAKVFGLIFVGYFSRPAYMALWLILAFVVILAGTFAEMRAKCRHWDGHA